MKKIYRHELNKYQTNQQIVIELTCPFWGKNINIHFIKYICWAYWIFDIIEDSPSSAQNYLSLKLHTLVKIASLAW